MTAACVDLDPSIFDTEDGQPRTLAADICASCPVAVECLLAARQRHEVQGIWGGYRLVRGRWQRERTSAEIQLPRVAPNGTRRCSKCRDYYPAEHYGSDRSRPDGKSARCRSCEGLKTAEAAARRRARA